MLAQVEKLHLLPVVGVYGHRYVMTWHLDDPSRIWANNILLLRFIFGTTRTDTPVRARRRIQAIVTGQSPEVETGFQLRPGFSTRLAKADKDVQLPSSLPK